MDIVDSYCWWIWLMDIVDGHGWCILMGYAKKNAGSWYFQPFKIGIFIDGMWMGIQWDMSPTISNLDDLGVSENAGYPKVAISTGIIMRNYWSEPVVPQSFRQTKIQHAPGIPKGLQFYLEILQIPLAKLQLKWYFRNYLHPQAHPGCVCVCETGISKIWWRCFNSKTTLWFFQTWPAGK